MESATQIDVQVATPAGIGQRARGSAGHDAGVVHQDVERAGGGDKGGYGAPELGRIGDIQLVGLSGAAGGTNRLNRDGRSLQVHVGDAEQRTLSGEQLGGGAADSRSRPGDEGSLVLEAPARAD